MNCAICGDDILPGHPGVYYSVTGWVKHRAQGGTNHIAKQVYTGQYAHEVCIYPGGPEQEGLFP